MSITAFLLFQSIDRTRTIRLSDAQFHVARTIPYELYGNFLQTGLDDTKMVYQ